MIENLLQKITPSQFFATLGILIATAATVILLIAAFLVATNFNILNWLE